MPDFQWAILLALLVWQAWRLGRNNPLSLAEKISILALAWCLFRVTAKAFGG
jgi:hypothetical protein